MTSVSENLDLIRTKIAEAEIRSGRPAGSVKLLAVSKFHPVEAVLEAVAAGQLQFGENRVQEAVSKFPPVLAENPQVELHLIGSLQRNKVKNMVPYACCIQSVDRYELAEEIIKQRRKCVEAASHAADGVVPPARLSLLFEVHTGEESKSGFTDRDELRRTLELCRDAADAGIVCSGFMTMAPNTDDESLVRESFRSLRLLAEDMRREYPDLPLTELSMGMSGDFTIAIEEGSTMVRIGTAIFGQRNYA